MIASPARRLGSVRFEAAACLAVFLCAIGSLAAATASAAGTEAPESEAAALVERALAEADAGRFDAGLEMLRRAKALGPGSGAPYAATGMVLVMSGRAAEAGAEFEAALRRAASRDERDSYITSIERITTVFRTKRAAELFADGQPWRSSRRIHVCGTSWASLLQSAAGGARRPPSSRRAAA
jgi:tetratricopeptide (TPR) repeat protein